MFKFRILVQVSLIITLTACTKGKLKKEIIEIEHRYEAANSINTKNKLGNILVQKYQEYHDRFPNDTSFIINYAKLHIRAMKQQEAIDLLNTYISFKKNNPEPYILRARANVSKGFYHKAKMDVLFAKSLTGGKGDTSLANFLNKIEVFIGIDSVVQIFNEKINEFPGDKALYNKRAVLFTKLENYEAALFDLDKALEIDPNYQEAAIGKANIMYKAGQFDDARKLINKILTGQPVRNDIKAEASKIDGYLLLHDEIDSLSKKLEYDPANKYEIINTIGRNYFQLNELDKASMYFNSAINLDPSKIGGYIYLAQVYITLEKLDDALRLVNHAIKLEPQNPDAYNIRGYIYMLDENIELAKADVELVMKLGGKLFPPLEKYNN